MSVSTIPNGENTIIILTTGKEKYSYKYDGVIDTPKRIGDLLRFNNYILAYFMINDVMKPICMSLGQKIILEVPSLISSVPESNAEAPRVISSVPESNAEAPRVISSVQASPISIEKEAAVPDVPSIDILNDGDDKITITIVGLKNRNATINIDLKSTNTQ
jgi:hypothetical protein